MRRLYALAGREPPERFTSLALRSPGIARQANDTLLAYGPITLEIDFSRVSSELIVFSGDAQDAAYQLDRVTWIDHTVGTAALLRELKKLEYNAVRGLMPRRIGSYYEARLLRPLVLADITAVYATGLKGLAAAQRLCGAAESVSPTVGDSDPDTG